MATLRDVLMDVYTRRGELTPRIVVEEARDEAHPLHLRIWGVSNEVAAYEWRLIKAQEIIRSVRIVFDDEEAPRDLRAFLATRDPETSRSTYAPTEEVMSDPISREIALRQMRRDQAIMDRRYAHMAEYAQMLAERAAELRGETG